MIFLCRTLRSREQSLQEPFQLHWRTHVVVACNPQQSHSFFSDDFPSFSYRLPALVAYSFQNLYILAETFVLRFTLSLHSLFTPKLSLHSVFPRSTHLIPLQILDRSTRESPIHQLHRFDLLLLPKFPPLSSSTAFTTSCNSPFWIHHLICPFVLG